MSVFGRFQGVVEVSFGEVLYMHMRPITSEWEVIVCVLVCVST